MRFCPPYGRGAETLLTMLTSAELTPTVAVAVLLAGFGSVALLDTVATFGVDALAMVMTTLNVADAPVGSAAIMQVTVPAAPTAGVVHPNVGPAVCDSETKVVPAGRGSVMETLAASLGPLFTTTIVHVTFEPALAEAGPTFPIARSASWVAVAVAVALLLAELGSVVDVLTVVVLEIVVPPARLLGA